MHYEEKISKAKAKLLVNYPFFGTIAARLELVLNENIESFTSDGIKLEFNDDFINASTNEELEFIFANGAMHASMAYENRQNNRSNWLWQMSCDYAINDMLVQTGMSRPYQAHYSERFKNMYVEEIYAELKADIIRDADELPDNDGDDVNEANEKNEKTNEASPQQDRLEESSAKTTSDQQLADQQTLDEQLFASFTQTILEQEQKLDTLPTTIERFFTLRSASKVDWREQLRDALDRFIKDDYIQMPPNKKFLSQGIYLPSSTSETFQLVIAIDNSGSIDEKLLETFLSEINSLMLSIRKYKIDLLVCDDKVREHLEFVSGESLVVNIKEGGATNFAPVFEFIDRDLQSTNLLLYFTDLEGAFPKVHPNYEVKWVSQNLCEIPFGEIIQI